MEQLPTPQHRLERAWYHLSLAGQFLITGSVVLLIGMAIIGVWVTERIEEGVTRNTAASTALYMESFVAPLVGELAVQDTLSAEKRLALDELLKNNELGRRVISFKIWKEGGLIAYSSRPSIIGQRFPTTPNLRAAWKGEVRAEFDTLEDEEDALERVRGIPLLEMYSPIREPNTGRIIAVAEFYERAEALKQNLFEVILQSWLVVALVTLAMLGALSGIVLRGSRTIKQQRIALEQRVNDLSELLIQNKQLSERLQRASQRTTEINESYLRRISADLHDGPAQLLSLGLLRLDSLEPLFEHAAESKEDDSEIQVVRSALTEAITDIRDICTGLTLPVLDHLTPGKLLLNAANAHIHRTRTEVELDIQSVPQQLAKSIKICIFRFVQETLSNAFRHAGGKGQKLSCRYEDGLLEVVVSDTGPGFEQATDDDTSHGLGLPGLHERIESLGGQLQIDSRPGEGSRIAMLYRIEGSED
ncbi:MAG: ATP-binding protein [Halopseudomonas sp.]